MCAIGLQLDRQSKPSRRFICMCATGLQLDRERKASRRVICMYARYSCIASAFYSMNLLKHGPRTLTMLAFEQA